MDGNIGRLYMWEFTIDPSINLWGLVQKTIAGDVRREAGFLNRDPTPPGARNSRHMYVASTPMHYPSFPSSASECK